MALMIVVNTPGSWSHVYAPFLHAPWHGFTPTDLVFPSFLFAVGNSMAFVSSKWQESSRPQVILTGIKRGLLIFLAGYLLYWFPFFRPNAEGVWVFKSIHSTRVFGVLQRIGFAYILTIVLVQFVRRQQLIMGGIGILISYWIIMSFWGDYSLENNAARTLDLWLLGEGHLYRGEGIPFDPEGILSTIPAVVNIVIGYLIGLFIRDRGSTYEMLSKLLLIGCLLMLCGYIWHWGFPINKKIWTSSYVLLTGGLNVVILGGIIYLMEFSVKHWRFGPFKSYGKNPLFIFLLSGIVVKMMFLLKVNGKSLYGLLYQYGFQWMGDKPGSLAFALFFALLFYLVSLLLERKNIIIKL